MVLILILTVLSLTATVMVTTIIILILPLLQLLPLHQPQDHGQWRLMPSRLALLLDVFHRLSVNAGRKTIFAFIVANWVTLFHLVPFVLKKPLTLPKVCNKVFPVPLTREMCRGGPECPRDRGAHCFYTGWLKCYIILFHSLITVKS